MRDADTSFMSDDELHDAFSNWSILAFAGVSFGF
jgi:hypothetical protein